MYIPGRGVMQTVLYWTLGNRKKESIHPIANGVYGLQYPARDRQNPKTNLPKALVICQSSFWREYFTKSLQHKEHKIRGIGTFNLENPLIDKRIEAYKRRYHAFVIPLPNFEKAEARQAEAIIDALLRNDVSGNRIIICAVQDYDFIEGIRTKQQQNPHLEGLKTRFLEQGVHFITEFGASQSVALCESRERRGIGNQLDKLRSFQEHPIYAALRGCYQQPLQEAPMLNDALA